MRTSSGPAVQAVIPVSGLPFRGKDLDRITGYVSSFFNKVST